jgi:hypothetical protein
MFSVKFSNNIKFKFTESQIKLIPYFKTLLESDFNKNLEINHSSTGFDFLHAFATMDEIDITDPRDKYLFVLKQCDFFCYNKLRDLIERKYGHRAYINNEIEDKFNSIIQLRYVGSFIVDLPQRLRFGICNCITLITNYKPNISIHPYCGSSPNIINTSMQINKLSEGARIFKIKKLYYEIILHKMFKEPEKLFEKDNAFNIHIKYSSIMTSQYRNGETLMSITRELLDSNLKSSCASKYIRDANRVLSFTYEVYERI